MSIKKRKKPNKDTVEKRIKKNQGLWLESYIKRWTVTAACKEIGIARNTVYEWFEKYPEFKEKVEDESKTQQDYVATMLVKSINDMNIAAIIFWLKHRHPDYKIEQFKFKGEVESKVKLDISDEQFEQLIKNLARRRQKDSSVKEGSKGKTD